MVGEKELIKFICDVLTYCDDGVPDMIRAHEFSGVREYKKFLEKLREKAQEWYNTVIPIKSANGRRGFRVFTLWGGIKHPCFYGTCKGRAVTIEDRFSSKTKYMVYLDGVELEHIMGDNG